jgi:hypothetical protein
MGRKLYKKPRSYVVALPDEQIFKLQAHFAFDNGEGGLLFRRYNDDSIEGKTHVVMAFAKGAWSWFKEEEPT